MCIFGQHLIASIIQHGQLFLHMMRTNIKMMMVSSSQTWDVSWSLSMIPGIFSPKRGWCLISDLYQFTAANTRFQSPRLVMVVFTLATQVPPPLDVMEHTKGPMQRDQGSPVTVHLLCLPMCIDDSNTLCYRCGIMRITYVTLSRFFTPFRAKLSLVQGFWCWPDL